MEKLYVETKPRINYLEFIAVRKPSVNLFKPHTLAWVFERYIREMNGSDTGKPVRTLGKSNVYTLRELQRDQLGAKDATKLTKHDVIELAKRLGATGRRGKRSAATVNQYIGYLNVVLKYAPSAWEDCEGISHQDRKTVVEMATPFLRKHNYISASLPRTRRPTQEEIDRLIAFHSIPPKRKFKNLIDMVKMTLWQLRSARRVGESCRLEWGWWNKEDQTMLVRNMKHPKKKDHHVIVALPNAAQAMLIELEKERLEPGNPRERIFKYKSSSVSQKHALACKRLGIPNLRLHDSRRDCGTRLVEDDGYSVEQAIMVTGHVGPQIFVKNYLSQDAAKFKEGPRNAKIEGVLAANEAKRVAGLTPEQIKRIDENWAL